MIQETQPILIKTWKRKPGFFIIAKYAIFSWHHKIYSTAFFQVKLYFSINFDDNSALVESDQKHLGNRIRH